MAEFSKYSTCLIIILEMTNRNIVISEVDALIYVVLSEADKDVSYGELFVTTACVGRDRSLNIATRYGLDGPGI
jgi:hypothetical protein